MKRSKELKRAWRARRRNGESLRQWARLEAEAVHTASFTRVPDLAVAWLKAKGISPSTTQSAA